MVSHDRDFVRTNVRGDASFGGETTIRSRGNRVSADTRGSARIGTDGRGGRSDWGNAQFHSSGNAQLRGSGMSGGAAMDGGARGGMR
jgi:hypothetical protein